MSLRASISARAEADLTHQYRWYVDNASEDVAERFLAEFGATVSKLLQHPHLGRRRKFRAPELAGIRSLPIGGAFGVHLVFYHCAEKELSIERVMHGARDIPRRIVEPPQLES